jgi:cytochrome c556
MEPGLWIGAIAVGLTGISILSNAIQFRSKAAVDTVTILKGAVDTLRQELTDLKAKLDQCHADCEKLRNQIIADGSDGVRQQLTEVTARYATLQEQYRILRVELADALRLLNKFSDPPDEPESG